ncbi:hypothetical protein OAM67_01195 [bacterium]|jgi:hypothetical protein|nr:hypothetical protein [bacterium]
MSFAIESALNCALNDADSVKTITTEERILHKIKELQDAKAGKQTQERKFAAKQVTGPPDAQLGKFGPGINTQPMQCPAALEDGASLFRAGDTDHMCEIDPLSQTMKCNNSMTPLEAGRCDNTQGKAQGFWLKAKVNGKTFLTSPCCSTEGQAIAKVFEKQQKTQQKTKPPHS